MPSLTIIAGPNGAGKTRISGFFEQFRDNLENIIDLDLLLQEATNEIPYSYYSANEWRQLDKLFKRYCEQAIEKKADFCYECNLRDDQVKNVGLFEEAGYQLNLIYLTLNSIEQSRSRVNYRVKHEKGRYVNDRDLRENFVRGIENLDNHYADFDSVIIIDNSIDFEYQPKITFAYDKDGVYMAENFPPQSLKQYFKNIEKLKNFIK